MPELVEQVLAILRGMWQRRWIGLGVAWLAAIVGVALVESFSHRLLLGPLVLIHVAVPSAPQTTPVPTPGA